MAPARSPESLRDALVVDLALVAVVLMWASTFVTFKIAWRDVDPVAFTGLRFAAMCVFAGVSDVPMVRLRATLPYFASRSVRRGSGSTRRHSPVPPPSRDHTRTAVR